MMESSLQVSEYPIHQPIINDKDILKKKKKNYKSQDLYNSMLFLYPLKGSNRY